MRMRKKRNLEQRLSDCGEYYTELIERDLDLRQPEHNPLDLEKLFHSKAPILLEIGCGKGAFAAELARRYPEYNVLAVEKCKNVLLTACQNAAVQNIKNLRFICGGAEYLARHLPRGCAQRIYLNFSCPYPKAKYANHRLTAPRFLEVYKYLLAENAEIHQKTDHPRFFEFSLEQLSAAGFLLKNISLDLHQSGFKDNILTEYEQIFSAQGKPIYRLEAYLKK